MFTLFKYTINILIFISMVLLYLLYTPWGNSHIYSFASYKLSQKSDMLIEVQSINVYNYPDVNIEMNIERKAKLTLNGEVNDHFVDMDYTLTSECIASDICKIDDEIDIEGHIKGPFYHINIRGQGTALDGNVSYSVMKFTDKVENLKLAMRDVNSSKLATLLGQDALIKGSADVDVNFKIMDEHTKKGYFTYDVKDHNFSGMPLNLHTKVNIDGMKHTFVMNVTSPHVLLNITKGHYDQEKKLATAFYTLDIKDLTKFESILGFKYLGPFYTMGEIKYDKYLRINGLSKTFGGMTDFLFEKDGLHIELYGVSFKRIMEIFEYPSILTADTNGDIYYNFIQETMVVNAKLKNAKFLDSKLVNIVRKKSGVNMRRETFDNCYLDLTYHNAVILGTLKFSNKRSHVKLSSAKMDFTNNTVNAYFDFKMQKQEFTGKVYGSIDDPKVNLNMQKLIQYQMDKQLDAMMGKNNRKMMNKIPMAPMAKDVAAGMGASFIKVFF